MARDIPPEIQGWNWGAFLLGPIWAIGNRVFLGLLGCLPAIATYTALIIALILMPFPGFFSLIPASILGLMAYTPAYVCIAIYLVGIFSLGIKGNEWAWRKSDGKGITKFKRRQRTWTIAGIFLGAPVTWLNLHIAASVPNEVMRFFALFASI